MPGSENSTTAAAVIKYLFVEFLLPGMAITKSAKKAWRQSLKRRAKNAGQKKKLRDALKSVRALASQKKIDEAKKLLPSVYKTLDKAAKVGLIKKNTASRTKSRLAKSLK